MAFSSVGASAKQRPLKGLHVAKHCLRVGSERRNIVAQVRRGAGKSAPPWLITAGGRCCDNLLTLTLTSGDGRAYKPIH